MKSLDGVNKKNDVNNTASEAPEKNVKTESEKIDFSKVKVEPLFEEFVDFDTFSKSDFRAVKVKECVAVPKSKKLLQFTLDDGTGTDRTILSGIHSFYVAGLVVSMIQKEDYLASRFSTLSYLYLSPIFFASIGLKVVIPQMSATIVWFAVILTVVAILTKVVGCGLGARLCKYSGRESLQIGVGMISRGEVALIVASKGEALGLMSEQLMGPVVIVVIITTIVAPILLKPVFHDKKEIKEKA